MSYGQPLSSTLPVVSVTPAPDWATLLNAFLTEVQGVIEAKVTPAGININAALDMLAEHLEQVGGLELYPLASALAAATYERTLFSLSSDGELYYNDGSGNQVKLTLNGALNAASLGGIGGDYGGANPAAVDFSDANKLYDFLDEPGLRAILRCADLQIAEQVAGVSKYVTLQSPASLAASYDLILPAAQPASTALVTMDNSGQLATTRDPSVDTLALTGALTASGNVTGDLLSASSGLKPGASEDTIANYQEVATFTPELYIDSSELSTLSGASYTTQVGEYTQIGKLIFIFVEIICTTPSSGLTNIAITVRNLPAAIEGKASREQPLLLEEFGGAGLNSEVSRGYMDVDQIKFRTGMATTGVNRSNIFTLSTVSSFYVRLSGCYHID